MRSHQFLICKPVPSPSSVQVVGAVEGVALLAARVQHMSRISRHSAFVTTVPLSAEIMSSKSPPGGLTSPPRFTVLRGSKVFLRAARSVACTPS